MPDDIQHLTAAMAAGDSDAVGSFYRDYFDWMYIQAKLATRRDESFCLDVVQDAVLRVMRTIRPVDSEARLRAWLRLVVQTTAFDLIRNQRRRTAREAASVVPETIDTIDRKEQLDWLAQQLKRLDPQLVTMIELRFDQQWTLQRIGRLLGLSTGAIDSRLRRVLKNLRSAAKTTTLFDLEDEGAMHDDKV
jgi:RNA polymerase sigma-70 factor (ECF subfamily)